MEIRNQLRIQKKYGDLSGQLSSFQETQGHLRRGRISSPEEVMKARTQGE